MYKIHIICGKGGSGKDTVVRKILHKYPRIITDTPYTTRPMREGEIEGKEYFFKTEEEYQYLKDHHPESIVEERQYETTQGVWRYWHQKIPTNLLDNLNLIVIATPDVILKYAEVYGVENINVIEIEISTIEQLRRLYKREMRQLKKDFQEVCRRILSDGEWDTNPEMSPMTICKNNSILYTSIDATLPLDTELILVENAIFRIMPSDFKS